jgi:hypothetical protein
MQVSLPYMGLAIWIGWRYFRRFAIENPADFEQTCALGALRCVGLSDPEAYSRLSSLFIRTLRDYGYSKNDNGRWMRRELIKPSHPDEASKCGVCGAVGSHLDGKFRRLCRRHYQYALNRRKRGHANPYEGIEGTVYLRQARRLVRCTSCSRWKSELVKRIETRKHLFCDPSCYRAWRRGKSMKEVKAA